MDIDQKAAYLLRRIAHRNLNQIIAVMTASSVTSITAFAVAEAGVAELKHDMDHTYGAGAGDKTSVSHVELERLTYDDEGRLCILREEHSFRDAVREAMRDVLKSVFPAWSKATEARGAICLTTMHKDFHGAIVDIRGLDNEGVNVIIQERLSRTDPLAIFGYSSDSDPMNIIQEGWYGVANADQARSVGELAQTNILDVYNAIEGISPHIKFLNDMEARPGVAQWYAMLRHDGPNVVADVVLAAHRAGQFQAGVWPGAGYVVGYKGLQAYPEFGKNIESLAEVMGLHIEPNHLGYVLDESQFDIPEM